MNFEPLWYWMNERHRIYIRKLNGQKPPYTDDPILQEYRFCNVYRELDKVTAWIRENWRDKYARDQNLWFAMCVARQINHIPTLRNLGYPIGSLDNYLSHALDVLSRMHEAGGKIYGSAYIITAGGQAGPKYQYTIRILRKLTHVKNHFKTPQSLERMWRTLNNCLGFGPFISYEVVTDLRWTRYYDGSDHMTWANAGPGALRGLGRLYHGSKHAKPKPKEALTMMQELLRLAPANLPPTMPELELRDIEHSLCETDKYLRAKLGQGRPKARYHA